MTFLQMKCFLSLAKTQKMSVTADAVGISLSTLSKYVDKMENELSVKLFIKNQRHIILSQEGELILPSIEHIIRQYDEQRAKMTRYSSPNQATINVVLAYYQSRVLHRLFAFMNIEPDITLSITEDPANNICATLDSGEADIGFVYKQLLDKKYPVMFSLSKDRLVAVVSENHPLANRGTISLKELQDETFCFFENDLFMYRYQMQVCVAAGFVPKIEHNGFRMNTILQYVATGNCVSLFADSTSRISGVSVLKLEENPPLTMCAVTASLYHSEALDKLLTFFSNDAAIQKQK